MFTLQTEAFRGLPCPFGIREVQMPRCPATCPLGGQGFPLSRAGLAPFVSPSVVCVGVGRGMHFTPTLLGEQPMCAVSRCGGLLRAEQAGLVSRSAEMQAPGSLLPALLSLPQRQPSSTVSTLPPSSRPSFIHEAALWPCPVPQLPGEQLGKGR